jgi:hypothetical protein
MLAKLTSKNQLTLPKNVIKDFPAAEYFDVTAEGGRIVLTPVRVTKSADPDKKLKPIWDKLQKLGITEKDVEDAVKWARRRK